MRKSIPICALCFLMWIVSLSAVSFAQIGISISFGPPPLPVYEQPPCPAEGYLWQPGYWAYDYDYNDYYWVPGTWVLAPQPGLLWTPGYWAWADNRYIFHEGYWGPHVGFYGGVAYGYGYFGHGYEGGRWDRDRFYYNRTVNNVNTTVIHNVYNTTIINKNVTVNRVSYNGGNGGITTRPTRDEDSFDRERHIPPVATQVQHAREARSDPELRASRNQGRPAIAATDKPADFHGRQVVAAREAGGPYHPPANQPRGNATVPRPENNVPRPSNPIHARDLPPRERPAPPNSGNVKLDQKYQQQQDKLYSRQQRDQQKLEQRQEKDDQRLQQKRANDAAHQQMEQRHQQQTQKMQQQHVQQEQKLQQKQHPPERGQAKPPSNQPPPH